MQDMATMFSCSILIHQSSPSPLWEWQGPRISQASTLLAPFLSYRFFSACLLKVLSHKTVDLLQMRIVHMAMMSSFSITDHIKTLHERLVTPLLQLVGTVNDMWTLYPKP